MSEESDKWWADVAGELPFPRTGEDLKEWWGVAFAAGQVAGQVVEREAMINLLIDKKYIMQINDIRFIRKILAGEMTKP